MTHTTLAPDPYDFLALEQLLSDEERMVSHTVRKLVDEKIKPNVGEWFENCEFPRELATEFGKLGMLGMHLTGYGCAGMSAVAYGSACLELEAGDSGARSFVSVQGSLAMFPIWKFGSEEQKQEWLPRMAAGEAIGCFGLTEPDSGSDPSSMRTTARRDGNDWVLGGTKMWITNGSIADVALIWAQTDEGIRGFVVDTKTPGYQARKVDRKMSLRASITAEIVLDNVRLPGSAVLPGVTGIKGPLSCLNEARFGILFGAVGAARDCYETALEYTMNRTQFGKPLAGFQFTQGKLADMLIRVNRAHLLALHLGKLKDAGTLAPAQISFGKKDNVAQALHVAREARGMLGASGITLEYPVIRHMNNLESVSTYEGTNEVHTLVLGQALTNIGAFR
ncbi:acyl-CoA dehydrogenase family protein [Rhodococcus sp. T2V]|uniref:acyl-CoA dehydrogenase family protein n=1 Tax=Rhodococcus sp. T2V TaxID=3034164 RepID=UPI0023E2C2CB|nr:acyl-CoA dehydrogenase family protein [Rhodococcus sp. T2V]MDF3312326.1 acyl-CoA dehydrogenase family protein [Rhodococcus sp. T2V]